MSGQLTDLLEEMEAAEQCLVRDKEAEAQARRTATQAENRVLEARKAVVKHLEAFHPALVSDILSKRG